MAGAIPEGDEGLVLDIADWRSPFLGACAALGIDDSTAAVDLADGGDAAEGDGLRRIPPRDSLHPRPPAL